MRSLPWLLLLAALVAAGAGAYYLQRQRVVEAEARRGAEAEALRAAGQVVVERRDHDHLEAEVERLTEINAELAAALARARRAAPGARPVAVASASTGPVVVEAPQKILTPGVNEIDRAPDVPCLLAAGDRAELRVDEVVLETRAGNRVLVGAASAWRLEPAPVTRLFSGPFSAPLASAEAVEPAPAGVPTWALVAVGVGALALGGLVGTGLAR